MNLTRFTINSPVEKTIKKIGEESAELIYAINQNDKKN